MTSFNLDLDSDGKNSSVKNRGNRGDAVMNKLVRATFKNKVDNGEYEDALKLANKANLPTKTVKASASKYFQQLMQRNNYKEALDIAHKFNLGSQTKNVALEKAMNKCLVEKNNDLKACKNEFSRYF